MAKTLLQLQNDVYEILGKSSSTYGLLTPAKVTAMINDSMRHIMVQMLGMSASWDTKIAFLDITGGSNYVDFPVDCAVINYLKIKASTTSDYVAITYNENYDGVTSTQTSSVGNYAPIYHFVNGKIYLEPIPDLSLTGALMIEYVAFPTVLVSNTDTVTGDFGGLVYLDYVKWRSASMLRSITQSDASPVPWAQYEREAYNNVMTIISRRKRVASTIRGIPY
jgi:hypothetical protein